MASRDGRFQQGTRMRPLLPENPRTAGLPQEIILTIVSFALDDSRTFDRLVELHDMEEPERVRGIPVEGDDGNIRYWLVRTETWLSTVCSTWRDWIYNWQSVGLNKLSPYELKVTAHQWLNPSFPMLVLLSIRALRPYRKLHIYFSKFITPPASLDLSETTALLFPSNSNEKQRPEFSSYLTDIHLTLSNHSSVALDAILGAYDLPPHFNIIFTFNSGSRMFLSSFTSVQIDTEMHLTFEINSWRAGLGAEVPSMIASIANWIWPSGGVGKSSVQVKLPRDGYEFRELTKGWKRMNTPPFLRNWYFDAVALEGFGGGSMILDFLTCAGIRIFTRSLVLITYPMKVCFFHDCHSPRRPYPVLSARDTSFDGVAALVKSSIPTEIDAPFLPEAECADPSLPNSKPFTKMERQEVLRLAASPRIPITTSPSLPPSPPLETAIKAGQDIRPKSNVFLSSQKSPPPCHECHKLIDRQPYDLTWVFHDPEILANHRVRSIEIMLCEGESLLPLEQHQLRSFTKVGIATSAFVEDA